MSLKFLTRVCDSARIDGTGSRVNGKPHIALVTNWKSQLRWCYFPKKGLAYNVGINEAANAFCLTLNYRQFGDWPF